MDVLSAAAHPYLSFKKPGKAAKENAAAATAVATAAAAAAAAASTAPLT